MYLLNLLIFYFFFNTNFCFGHHKDPTAVPTIHPSLIKLLEKQRNLSGVFTPDTEIPNLPFINSIHSESCQGETWSSSEVGSGAWDSRSFALFVSKDQVEISENCMKTLGLAKEGERLQFVWVQAFILSDVVQSGLYISPTIFKKITGSNTWDPKIVIKIYPQHSLANSVLDSKTNKDDFTPTACPSELWPEGDGPLANFTAVETPMWSERTRKSFPQVPCGIEITFRAEDQEVQGKITDWLSTDNGSNNFGFRIPSETCRKLCGRPCVGGSLPSKCLPEIVIPKDHSLPTKAFDFVSGREKSHIDRNTELVQETEEFDETETTEDVEKTFLTEATQTTEEVATTITINWDNITLPQTPDFPDSSWRTGYIKPYPVDTCAMGNNLCDIWLAKYFNYDKYNPDCGRSYSAPCPAMFGGIPGVMPGYKCGSIWKVYLPATNEERYIQAVHFERGFASRNFFVPHTVWYKFCPRLCNGGLKCCLEEEEEEENNKIEEKLGNNGIMTRPDCRCACFTRKKSFHLTRYLLPKGTDDAECKDRCSLDCTACKRMPLTTPIDTIIVSLLFLFLLFV